MNTLAIKDPKFSITPTGIQFSEDITEQEWATLGGKLGEIHNSMSFAIGDWINYANARWGERYDQAMAITGLSYKTLATYAHVSRRVDFSTRVENLDHCIHRTVAKLKDPDEQKYWLNVAQQNKLSVRRLIKSINFGRLATEDEVHGDPSDKGVVTHLALINRLIRWWKQTTADDPVEQWDEEQRENVKKDFGRLIEIYEAL
jgi:hypothetical protein